MNPAAASTIRAARAAKAQRAANQPKLRTGRRTAQAIAALVNLRADIAAGLPAVALLDRVDDELFRLKSGKKP